METEKKIQQLMEAKCSIPDCNEKQFLHMQMGMLLLPFCENHYMKIMEKNQEWNKITKKVERIMKKSKGETITIHSFEEMQKKLKPEFLALTTKGLELTKGKCLECGKKAIGIVRFIKPVCEEHMGFPRQVIKEALK